MYCLLHFIDEYNSKVELNRILKNHPTTHPDKAMTYQHNPDQINQLADDLENPDFPNGSLTAKAAFHLRELQGRIFELEAQPPVQQEPVAWIEHEWSGTGLRHLHFEKREPTVREEVVNPVWTPLYTMPHPLTDEQIWSDDRIMEANSRLGLLMKDLALLVRAVEATHGITGGQQ